MKTRFTTRIACVICSLAIPWLLLFPADRANAAPGAPGRTGTSVGDSREDPIWISDGPINLAGRCLAIKVHPTNPSVAYAGFAGGGLWKTTDAGATWTPLGDSLPVLAVSALKIDPVNPNRIWIGTGEGSGNPDAVSGVGVLASTDGGSSWVATGYSYPPESGRDVFALEYNPSDGTLLVAADNGLWRSANGGVNFAQVGPDGSWRDVQLKRGSASVLFACMEGAAGAGFYRSTDDGQTWSRITNGTPTSNIYNSRIALTDADPQTIYWAIANGQGATLGIYRSTDGGDSFTVVSTNDLYGGEGASDLTISITPTNKNEIWSGGVDLFRSTNGGYTWTQWAGNVHTGHHAASWAPGDPTQFWLGTDGGVWRSSNGGVTFLERNAGLVTAQFNGFNQGTSLPTRLIGGTQDNGVLLTDNAPTWLSTLAGEGHGCEVDRSRPDTMYTVLGYGTHRRTTDGGATWVNIGNGIAEQGPWSTPTWMDLTDSRILWTAHLTRIYRTTNMGNQWVWMNNPAGLGGGRSIHQSASDPLVLAVVGGSKVFLTTDAGTTWADRTSGMISGAFLSDVAIDPSDPNIIVVTLAAYGATYRQVQKSTNQGLSWLPIDVGLPDEPCNAVEIDPRLPSVYYVGTNTGVFVTLDGGSTWSRYDAGLPHAVVIDLRIQDELRLLRAATHGRGIWEAHLLDPASVEGPATAEEPPLTLRINGNPAWEQLHLEYGMRRPGWVTLSLFDLQGRLVRSLKDGFEGQELYKLDVDVRELSSGVYIARLVSGGFGVSRKVVVLH